MKAVNGFLFVTLIVLLAASVFFKGLEKSLVDSYKDTSTHIREAGHR